MKYLHPYRIAAVLLVLFCLAHSAGGLFADGSVGAAGDAVFQSMKSVHFDAFGADCTYYGWWMGFGLTASAFLLLSAVIAWQLAKVAPAQWPAVAVIAWALFAANVFNSILAWKYFFLPPQILSTIVCLLLAAGAVMQGKPRRRQSVVNPKPI